jgi:hypothetical protein
LWLEFIAFNLSLPADNTATSNFPVRLLHRALVMSKGWDCKGREKKSRVELDKQLGKK